MPRTWERPPADPPGDWIGADKGTTGDWRDRMTARAMNDAWRAHNAQPFGSLPDDAAAPASDNPRLSA